MHLSPLQSWISAIAPTSPVAGVVAYNFNMAEPAFDGWSVELIGAGTYDPADPDWCCPPEAWTSRPNEFILSRSDFPTWEAAQKHVFEEVREFIEKSPDEAATVLRGAQAVCVAFVDGELAIIWPPVPA